MLSFLLLLHLSFINSLRGGIPAPFSFISFKFKKMSMPQVFEQSLFLFLPVLGKGEKSIRGGDLAPLGSSRAKRIWGRGRGRP